jgi:transmembrane sensor
MIAGRSNASASEQRFEEACDWRDKHRTADLVGADLEEWKRWIAVPENQAEYHRLTELGTQLRQLSRPSLPNMFELSAYLAESSAEPPTQAWAFVQRAWQATLSMRAGPVLVMMLLLVGSGLVFFSKYGITAGARSTLTGHVYETTAGEQREFELADGSEIILFGETFLRTEFPGHPRMAALDRGRVIIQVKHDPSHPFVLYAGTGSVSAIGTAFDVRQDDKGTNVFVTDGVVSVDPQADEIPGVTVAGGPRRIRSQLKHAMVRLVKGQEVDYTADGQAGLAREAPLDESREPRPGLFVYNKRRLRDVIDDLQRYTARPVILDSSLDDFQYSGTFRKDSIEQWFQEMQHNQEAPFQIDEQPGRILIGPRKDRNRLNT